MLESETHKERISNNKGGHKSKKGKSETNDPPKFIDGRRGKTPRSTLTAFQLPVTISQPLVDHSLSDDWSPVNRIVVFRGTKAYLSTSP